MVVTPYINIYWYLFLSANKLLPGRRSARIMVCAVSLSRGSEKDLL